MQTEIWNREVECMPLPQLVDLCERKLRESGVMVRAARSPLYREKWKAVGVRPEEVRTYADLAKFPYTYGSDFREAQTRFRPYELVCAEQVRFWQSTSGTTGTPKWIAIGDGDVTAFHEASPRIMDLVFGTASDFSVLFLTAPSPFSTEPTAYMFLVSQLLGDRPTEFIVVALSEVFDAIQLARRARTRALFGFASLALVIGKGVAEQAGSSAREMLRKEHSLRNLLAAVLASVIPLKAKNIFKFRMGAFSGEPVEPYRKALRDAYGFDPSSAYGATEFGTPTVGDCSARDGMHISLDFSLPEIIPQTELDKEELDAAYVPQAVPLWHAQPGLIGELVLTSFADAMPLIRYRISDLTEVVSTERCICGRTLPRIRVRHRSDDIVNLGLVRFSIYELKEKLEAVAEHGQVAKWQLRITRVNSKPKAIVLVQPVAKVAAEPLIREIKDKIDELTGVRQAWQNGMIAEPEVRLVDQVEEQRTATGKIKLAVYEQEYFRET